MQRCSRRAMGNIKNLDSTAIYAYTTLISVLLCVPAALIFEGPHLKAAAEKALESHPDFYFSLFMVGLLYHLYNQVRPSIFLLAVLRLYLVALPGASALESPLRIGFLQTQQNEVGSVHGEAVKHASYCLRLRIRLNLCCDGVCSSPSTPCLASALSLMESAMW